MDDDSLGTPSRNSDVVSCSSKESSDWLGVLGRRTDHTSEDGCRWLSDDKRSAPETEDEEAVSDSVFRLPRVELCDGPRPPPPTHPRRPPRISDLCKEDKQKIATLVGEIARYREDEKNKTSQVKSLTDENEGLKTKLNKLEKELSCLHLTMRYSEENYKVQSKTFSDKEASLREQNSDIQNKLLLLSNEKSDVQLKLKEGQNQIEQLSRAIYNVSMENKMINKKYEHTKEKLKSALETINRLESEYEQSNNKTNENKKTQTESFVKTSQNVKCSNERRKDYPKFHRGHSWKYENRQKESSDEDSLLSELFFIPKQKNLSKPQYTSDDEFY